MIITSIHGIYDPIALSQNCLLDASRQLHPQESGVFVYDDSGESEDDQIQRIGHILGGADKSDSVILQMGTGNSMRFNNNLVNWARYTGCRVIIMVVGVDHLTDEYLYLFNRADVLIVQTPDTKALFRQRGVDSPEIIVSGLFDFPMTIKVGEPAFNHKVNYFDLTGFAQSYQGPGDIKVMRSDIQPLVKQMNMTGGFGLVQEPSLASQALPYTSLGTSITLAANLPLLAQQGTATAKLIDRYRIGVVYGPDESYTARLQNMDESTYHKLAANATKIGALVRQGQFIANAIAKAEKLALLK